MAQISVPELTGGQSGESIVLDLDRSQVTVATVAIELDYIIHGEFIESLGKFKFEGDKLTLSITNLNFGSPPVILHGSIEK